MPVRKVAADGPCPMAAPGGDDLPFVYSGTLVVHGHGLARVERIGPGTELGKIAGRSRRSTAAMLRVPNPALWWVLAGATLFLIVVLYVPVIRNLFRFSFLHPDDLGICLLAGAGLRCSGT